MDVAKVDRNVAYIASVSDVCCKRLFKMFHLFQIYVVSVLSGCCIYCSGYTYMLQAYVLNISSASIICCSKCFMLQV
jgi:hypothetical protein